MSNQQNPHAYSLMCRCPLRDAAKIKTKADKNGLALSAYVAKLIKEDAGNDDLTKDEKQWVEDHLTANIARRKKADEKTADGFYRGKRKKRGRPRKRGRPKGSKKAIGASKKA